MAKSVISVEETCTSSMAAPYPTSLTREANRKRIRAASSSVAQDPGCSRSLSRRLYNNCFTIEYRHVYLWTCLFAVCISRSALYHHVNIISSKSKIKTPYLHKKVTWTSKTSLIAFKQHQLCCRLILWTSLKWPDMVTLINPMINLSLEQIHQLTTRSFGSILVTKPLYHYIFPTLAVQFSSMINPHQPFQPPWGLEDNHAIGPYTPQAPARSPSRPLA